MQNNDSTELKKQAAAKFVVVNDTLDEFEDNEERRFLEADEKARILKERLKSTTVSLDNAKSLVKSEIRKLEIEWPALFGETTQKIYAHVDLDSFYASVETLLHPEFKDVPLGVGSNLMLAASNYKAREFNVKAGMPGFHAKSLCPNLVITPCNFTQYNLYSEKVMEVLSSFDPEIEIYGIDEACMIFDEEKLKNAYAFYNKNIKFGKLPNEEELVFSEFSPESAFILIEKIRGVVFRNTKLTISAGLSVCRGLAKFASNIKKPNGQFMIKEDFDSHILDLDVDKVNGIGKMTKEMLRKTIGVFTIRELRAHLPECAIMYKYKSFINLLRLSFGLSLFDSKGTRFKRGNFSQSIAMCYTIKSTVDYSDICGHLWEIATTVSKRLKSNGLSALLITLTIKYGTFVQTTRRAPSLQPINSTESIFELAMKLISENFIEDKITRFKTMNEPIRLLGITAGKIIRIDKVNTLENFSKNKIPVRPRECFICKETFIHESQHIFEAHVNSCVNQLCEKERKLRNTLDFYFKKK